MFKEVHKTKYLVFVKVGTKPKTEVYDVLANNTYRERLGQIKWFPKWRHYCFFSPIEYEVVLSDRCLRDISDFVSRLNDSHKKKKVRGN